MIYDLDHGTVEAIAMDMSASFVKAAKSSIPLAEEKIVHDRFHVMQLAGKAVDLVRRSEHRQLKKIGDERLTGTKYLWLTSQENLSERQRERFEAAYDRELLTGKAWAFKEMKKLAKTIKERLANVVSYCTHRITNAMAEGLNSKIMSIKRRVGGYRNRENFKTAIYFYCGGLDLYPR